MFFRENTKRKAETLKICGWVSNLSDGRVEAVFEGDEDGILAIQEWLREGSPLARIDSIEAHWEDFKGQFDSFEVRFT